MKVSKLQGNIDNEELKYFDPELGKIQCITHLNKNIGDGKFENGEEWDRLSIQKSQNYHQRSVCKIEKNDDQKISSFLLHNDNDKLSQSLGEYTKGQLQKLQKTDCNVKHERGHFDFGIDFDSNCSDNRDDLSIVKWSMEIEINKNYHHVQHNQCNTKDLKKGRLVSYNPLNSKKLLALPNDWCNPVIGSDQQLPSVTSDRSKRALHKRNKPVGSYTFNRSMLKNAEVIGQVDDKFIACVIYMPNDENCVGMDNHHVNDGSRLLVLFDQHAVDERIRLECFIDEVGFYSKNHSKKNSQLQIKCRLYPPAEIYVTSYEIELMRNFRKELGTVGVQFALSKQHQLQYQTTKHKLFLHSVPSVFVNLTEQKFEAKGSFVNCDLIKEFIVDQLNLLQGSAAECNLSSPSVFKILASRACHGAIKFGDKLSREQCRTMIEKLGRCNLPFQCAHGRPSIAPLCNLIFVKKYLNGHCTSIQQSINCKKTVVENCSNRLHFENLKMKLGH